MQLKLFSASAALAPLAFLQASSAEPVERAAGATYDLDMHDVETGIWSSLPIF
ncbi:hypothetical protein THAOC_25681, partial [Thalassiosira oceanica]